MSMMIQSDPSVGRLQTLYPGVASQLLDLVSNSVAARRMLPFM